MILDEYKDGHRRENYTDMDPYSCLTQEFSKGVFFSRQLNPRFMSFELQRRQISNQKQTYIREHG